MLLSALASTNINAYCVTAWVSHQLADPLQHGDAGAEELFQYVHSRRHGKELIDLSVACEGESFRVRH